MGKVIKSHETKGPAEIESKRNYLFRECLRYAQVMEIPFQSPKVLPFNSMEALRIAIASNELEIIDLLFRCAWEEGKDLGDLEVLKETLSDEGLLEDSSSREVRRTLKQNTQEAIEKGLFGVPTFLYFDGKEEELFWGKESIGHLKMKIEGNDPFIIVKEKYEEFLTLFRDS